VSRRLLQTVSLLALAALLVSACSSTPPAPQGGEGGTLRLAYLADMAQADPDVFYDIEGNTVILSVYEGLLRYKPDSTEVIPSLAESWEVSPDGLTYTFKIRPGIRFHDGSSLTAADVRATYDKIIFPPDGVRSIRKLFYSSVASVERSPEASASHSASWFPGSLRPMPMWYFAPSGLA